jgi:plasmid stabilization system protein ParE
VASAPSKWSNTNEQPGQPSCQSYVVFILEEALEDLTTIVARISAENVAAAETLGNELIDQAMSLELRPYRGTTGR